MIINNINPTLFNLGPFEIRYYGLIYALGFIIGIYLMRYFAQKGYIKLDNEQINDLFFWLIIGVVVGARFFEVFIWNPSYYFSNPGEILAVWHGGLSFHGAIVGGILAIYWFSKKSKIKMMKILDLLVIPAALATALGRIGNFLNSELYGPVTNVPWCVNFKRIDDLCRHPYQLYSFIKRTIIFGILFFMNEKKHKTGNTKYKDGYIFWNFILLMGLGRFFLDFVRVDDLIYGLSTGQWLSLGMVIVSLIFLIKDFWCKK